MSALGWRDSAWWRNGYDGLMHGGCSDSSLLYCKAQSDNVQPLLGGLSFHLYSPLGLCCSVERLLLVFYEACPC